MRNALLAHLGRDRQAAPDTLMADRFLAALVRWAAKNPEIEAEIAVSTGIVTKSELAQILRALEVNPKLRANW